jgi:hypothetical protein
MPSIPAGNYCQVVTLVGKGASWENWEIHDEIEGQCGYYDPTPNVPPVSSFSLAPSADDAPLTVDVSGPGGWELRGDRQEVRIHSPTIIHDPIPGTYQDAWFVINLEA